MRQRARRQGPGVVVCAASAGGFVGLLEILRALPPTFATPILVVLHLNRDEPSALAQVLARASKRHVKEAEQGELLQPGTVYVAPPDVHLVVGRGGHVMLTHEPLEHYVRPAADPLFVSAARTYHRRVVAVVLSGSGSDGASGARAVHDAGGIVVVQDPADARFPSMPRAAIAAGAADHVLPLRAIPETLVRLAS